MMCVVPARVRGWAGSRILASISFSSSPERSVRSLCILSRRKSWGPKRLESASLCAGTPGRWNEAAALCRLMESHASSTAKNNSAK